jgi:ABC-2 type transport system permease protein
MMRTVKLQALKYGAITAINLQNQLAYVWDAFHRAFFIVVVMFIFAQLWTAVFQTQGVAVINGLTLANTIWYFLIAEMVEMGKFRHDIAISEEVKDGSIAYTLVRPYNYLAYHFFNGLGETVVKMGVLFSIGSLVCFYYAGWPPAQLVHLPAVLLILALAVLLDFCFLSMIGLLAFVTEDTGSFRLIYQKLIFILGGLLIPIDFLPDWLQTIARMLPFAAVTYAPAKLFVAFSWGEFAQLISLQLVWLGVAGGLLYAQYRWAARRLMVNGG